MLKRRRLCHVSEKSQMLGKQVLQAAVPFVMELAVEPAAEVATALLAVAALLETAATVGKLTV